MRGSNMNLIKTGNVVSLKGAKALVHFPADNVRREILVSDLESTSSRYPGRHSVNINPIRR